MRRKLVAEQRRVAGQQAAEREALLQQLQETRDQLHLEQLWRKEVGGGGPGCVRGRWSAVWGEVECCVGVGRRVLCGGRGCWVCGGRWSAVWG